MFWPGVFLVVDSYTLLLYNGAAILLLCMCSMHRQPLQAGRKFGAGPAHSSRYRRTMAMLRHRGNLSPPSGLSNGEAGSNPDPSRFSRRAFLRLAGSVAAVATLAGCTPPPATARVPSSGKVRSPSKIVAASANNCSCRTFTMPIPASRSSILRNQTTMRNACLPTCSRVWRPTCSQAAAIRSRSGRKRATSSISAPLSTLTCRTQP